MTYTDELHQIEQDARETARLNMYEDTTLDRHITNDPDGTLVLLCEACAAKYGRDLYLMERGADYGQCEECGKGWRE